MPQPIPVVPSQTEVPVPQPAVPSEIQDIPGFSVTEPVKSGHVTYTVQGIDEEGGFTASRRYNDFYALREHLMAHWPGVYIAPIPPKKTTGNKDDAFVEDRCVFLDRFIKQLAKSPALINSETFKTFSRQAGDIEKILNTKAKPNPEMIIEQYKTKLFVDEFPDDFLVSQSKDQINEFFSFCKRIAPVLNTIKKQAKNWGPIKQSHNTSFKSLIELLAKYEEETITTYADSNANKLVVGDINDTELKDKAEALSEELKNPFTEFYNWVRGECDDI